MEIKKGFVKVFNDAGEASHWLDNNLGCRKAIYAHRCGKICIGDLEDLPYPSNRPEAVAEWFEISRMELEELNWEGDVNV